MSPRPFVASFTQQEPISEEAIERAVEVMRTGRLHRYNTLEGESSDVSLLEQEFATYQGRRYCLGCAAGGYALQIALRATGVQTGDQVLTNGFTLAPVPGAISSVGGEPVFVETTQDLSIDLDDLERKIRVTGARYLLLSLMRGHLPDMDALMRIICEHDLLLIEDCAHTMGAAWKGRKSGNFGIAACFSTQTYKHLNSGEGGLIVSDDDEFMARAVMLSGSYMLYERHLTIPPARAFENIRWETPNCSGRLDNLRAAILRPQLKELDADIDRWNQRYGVVASILSAVDGIYLPRRPEAEQFVGSSIQFLIPGITRQKARSFVEANAALGVELKWFGDTNPVAYTSQHSSWAYIPAQKLPRTDEVLSGLFDMRLPLTFTLDDCHQISEIIVHCVSELTT